ncbi:unnamed protein product [Paramecium sonneborni]|uniref:Uncharacterized protein n=1 Tax=Paramecium sonneborni TaxID=65129 RepID=A0A8S1RJ49_9CILI|nr:unnamed protein product [Paramecium sonneborni]
MHKYQEALLKNTLRGEEITVNLQIYNSTAQQDRQQFLKALQELANVKNTKVDEQTRILQLKLPGTTSIANIKSDLEKYCNQKIILMCESMVPNPLDVIGDLKCTTQKQEVHLQLCSQVIAG